MAIPKPDPSVAQVFEGVPPAVRSRLLALRRLILETAEATEGVGPITETLKWGEPAYLTEKSRSGTTIRIGWKAGAPTRYGMYVHCQTNLVDRYRTLFADELQFDGNRAIIFDEADAVPEEPLAACIAMALTYHRDKKTART